MTRGTTPTFTLTLGDDTIDLAMAGNVYVTFRQGRRSLRKTGADVTVSGHTAEVTLTQEESLRFLCGPEPPEVQMTWVYRDGSRGSSRIALLPVYDTLEPEVLA